MLYDIKCMVPFTLEFNHKLWSCSFKLSCWSWPYWERSGAEKQRRKSRQSLPSQRSTLAWWIVMMLLWPALISGSNSGASEFLCKLLPITLSTAEQLGGLLVALTNRRKGRSFFRVPTYLPSFSSFLQHQIKVHWSFLDISAKYTDLRHSSGISGKLP